MVRGWICKRLLIAIAAVVALCVPASAAIAFDAASNSGAGVSAVEIKQAEDTQREIADAESDYERAVARRAAAKAELGKWIAVTVAERGLKNLRSMGSIWTPNAWKKSRLKRLIITLQRP